jgi:hypothetical protein
MYSHMEWKEDALCVYFAHQKNDQMGERPRDPRHIYANPLIPEICPILALGLYWLANDDFRDVAPGGNAPLFRGQNQYERFRSALSSFMDTPSIKRALESYSLYSNDVGCHSIRKGASTYTSSGSTHCPSHAKRDQI